MPRVCVAHGVLDEVSQDLRNSDRICTDRDRIRRELDLKGEAFGVGRVLKAGTHILNEFAELERLDRRRQLSRSVGTRARDGEKVAQLALKNGHGVSNAADRCDALRPAVRHGQQLRRSDDVLQR